MLLKYIQEGLSLGLKVHDTVLRFQISRLSMHVPDGVLTDMMGIEDCCFGMGGWDMCVCVFAGRLGWGLPLCLPPLEIQKAVCLALGLGTGGRYDVGLAIPGQEGRGGSTGGLFQIFWKRDTHTHILTRPKPGVSLTVIREKKLSFPPVSSYPGKPAIHQFAEASYLDQHGVCLNMVALDKVME